MLIQTVYCNHQSAGLAIRERLAFSSDEQLAEAYALMKDKFVDTEFVIVSTCNRVELYLAHEDAASAPAADDLARFLSDFHSIPLDEFYGNLLNDSDGEAVRHLFRVTSSLDSMVLGEPQIVSQVKSAYQIAHDNEACGPLTHALFQAAIRVSSRVRSETRLAEGRVSIASVAVGDFARDIFDRFDDKLVLIIGAGEMAEETLRYLKDEGVSEIVVINRSSERAEKLADAWGGAAKPISELDTWMAKADVIVSTTSADQPIVDVSRFQQVRLEAKSKPVFILDLGAPRDFEPAVGDIDDNVFLYDIDNLKAICDENQRKRSQETQQALEIIEGETEKFMHDVYHRATGPIIHRLREEWHGVRSQEVDRLFRKLSHLSDSDRKEIEKMIEQLINKLLHPPLTTLRDQAREGTPHGLLTALKQLFHLNE